MKCPNCGHDLTSTNHGNMCLNCGYHGTGQTAEQSQTASPAPTPQPTPVPPPPPVPAPVAPPVTPLPSVPTPQPTHEHPPMPEFAKHAFVHPADSSAHQPDHVTPPGSPEAIYPSPTNAFAAHVTPQADPNALPSNRKRKKWPIIAAVLGVLLIGGTSYAAYSTFVISPKHALLSYALKLSQAKRATLNGSFAAKSALDGPIKDADITLDGKYDITDAKNQKFDLKLAGSAGTYKIGGEVIVIGQTGYGKIDSNPFFDSLGIGSLTNQWFKGSFSSTVADDKCQSSFGKIDKKVLATFPVKNTKLAKLFDTVDGHKVRKITGSVDLAKLPAFVDGVNQKVPADCKVTLTKDDLKDLDGVDYTLWTSSNFDRLELKFTTENPKTNGNITLDTAKYNQAVSIVAPANAKDIKELAGDVGAAVPDGATRARDAQRKADIRAVQNALETYHNDKNSYPSGNYAGLSKILVKTYLPALPADPSGGSYVYKPTNCSGTHCQAFSLEATLETKTDADYPTYSVQSIGIDKSTGATGFFKSLSAFVLGAR